MCDIAAGPPSTGGCELPGLPCDLGVVGVTRGVEERLDPGVGEPFDQLGRTDGGLASTLGDLAREPLEVLACAVTQGEGVDGVLDRDRALLLQTAPDLDPEPHRPGWKLVHQQEPPGAGGGHARVLKQLLHAVQRRETRPARARTPSQVGVKL